MIYCKYCKYCKINFGHYCLHPDAEIEKKDYFDHWIEHAKCEDINPNNVCNLYEEKFNLFRRWF